MKRRHLLSASLLLLLASCTSDEIISTGGTEVPTGEGAVVFSLEGLGTGSVQNPDTRAGGVIATQAENRIDSLDIYVFAYDNDGTFNEDLIDAGNGAIQTQLTPADADVQNNTRWYLQEKWTWKDLANSSGKVDLSNPNLHKIEALGGSGVARTAVIYPTRGRYLKFFIVANGGELTANATETVFAPRFTAGAVIGNTAQEFLNLRLRLTERPVDPAQALAIHCPLPMTAQMASTQATAVNMTASAPTPVQSTCKATLTRAVTRFDVLNYAGYAAQGDYDLKSVIISNHHRYTNLANVIPAGTTNPDFEKSITKSLEGYTWSSHTDATTGDRAKLLNSAFYTSPTLAGTDPMIIGLRGVLGGTTAKPGDLLTPLNKDIKVMDPANPTQALVLKANYRYVLQIKKLGSDINVAFSILDWDSKVLDADFSNAPQPKLIWTNSTDITWDVADTDMNKHSVTMANTAVGQRLAFELGTYSEDEMAELLLDPTNPNKIPFQVNVVSLNDNPATDYQPWLDDAVITFDPIKRDRFNVVFNVASESDVPLFARFDLMVFIVNKEHNEKQLFFRVKSTWKAPSNPDAPIYTGPIIFGNPSYVLDMGIAGTTPVYVGPKNNTFDDGNGGSTDLVLGNANFDGHCPAGWRVPTLADITSICAVTDTEDVLSRYSPYFVASTDLEKAWPSKTYWTNTYVTGDFTRKWAFTTGIYNGSTAVNFVKLLVDTQSAASRCIQIKP